MHATPLKQSSVSRGVKAALAGTGAALAMAASAPAAAEVSVGGYVKADFIYDFDGKLGDTLYAPAVPLDGEDVEGEFRAHAKQTRINFSADHEDYSAFVEGDFFTSDNGELVSNSRHFRIRHAFGRWGNWLAGQTWSTFMDRDFIAYFPTVDFAGPAGVSFSRQAQLRWTSGDFAFALENPQTNVAHGFDEEGNLITLPGTDSMPDIVARYAVAGDVFSGYASAMVRRLEVDGGIADGESETVGALHVGAAINTGAGSLSGSVIVNGGRYTYYGFNNPELVVTGPGQVEFVNSAGVTFAWTAEWGNGAATTIGYGRTQFEDDAAIVAGLGPDANETLQTWHANYRWSTGSVSHGIEAQYAQRETFGGREGDDVRVQYGVRFNI